MRSNALMILLHCVCFPFLSLLVCLLFAQLVGLGIPSFGKQFFFSYLCVVCLLFAVWEEAEKIARDRREKWRINVAMALCTSCDDENELVSCLFIYVFVYLYDCL